MENHQQRKETKMKTFMTTAIFAIFPVVAMAAPATPPGAESLNCDIDKFKPVMSTVNPGEVLYWNNNTCAVPESGGNVNFVVGKIIEDIIESLED